jgi:glucose/arabinose dehydrogenase/regulation of enolase protein 1 (concanavalin A-like superfamily)
MNDQPSNGERWEGPQRSGLNEPFRPQRQLQFPTLSKSQPQKKKNWLWLGITLGVSILTAIVVLIPSLTNVWASMNTVKAKPAHAVSAVTAHNAIYPDLLPGFAKKQLASGLKNPVVFAFAPTGDIFVGEQAGTILVYHNGTILPTPLGTINTDGTNEKGLLGLAVDPNYTTNGYIYVSYTTIDEHAQLSRFTVQNGTINPASEVVFMKGNQLQNQHHSANDLHIGPDGKLWWTVGDNVPIISNGETLNNIYGKILRFRLNGSIPSDNPFLHVPGAIPAIYAYGLRNPFRFTFLPNGKAMVEDTGSSYWEELNTIQPGGNYGWDYYEGNCGSCGYINPAYAYGHLPIDGAASAIAAYSGSAFPKQYDNVVFLGDYNRQDIEAVTFDPTYTTEISDTVFDNAAGTIADMQEGPDGNLYFVSIFNDSFSEIYPTGPFVPTASISANQNAGLAPLTVQFSSAGSSDPYGLPLTYSWDFGDGSPPSTSTNPSHIYTTNGTYTATLTVNNGSQSASTSIQVVVGNTPPSASITSPTVNATYNGGDTISFSGTATDAQDGTLPASDYTWQVDFYSNGVAQPFYSAEVPQPFYGPASGITSGSFQIPQDLSNNASTFYRITMTVVDSLGLETVVTRDIHPNTTNWSVNTNVPGAAYVVDGNWHTTPYTTQDGVGVQHMLMGVPTQKVGSTRYRFNGWSDGSALTDSFSNPPTSTTYTANYDQVTSTLPSPWHNADVGSPLIAGKADYAVSDQTFYVDGSGADIWGTNDQSHYVYQTLNGDGTIVARLRYQTNSSAWAKAGLMIKQSTTAGSPYVDALVTPNVSPNTPNINGVGCTPDGCNSPLPPITPAVGYGVHMQYNFKSDKSVTSASALAGFNSPNEWLKLQRTGNTFTSWFSTDGNTWTQIGTTNVTMTGAVTIGLFVTSHNIEQTSTVAFDNVQVTIPSNNPVPPPWNDTDVGSPAISGSASYTNGTFTVNGEGVDIWGTNDQFNYVYQNVSGNGTLIARVTSQSNTSANAKAGIMFKQSTTAGSSYILIAVAPGGGVKVQYNFNGSSGGGTYTFPNVWMKLTRAGNKFTAYVSADGSNWTQVVSKTLTITTNATFGLFACSHNVKVLGTATFDNVSFTPGP